jgi:hypothetical protein
VKEPPQQTLDSWCSFEEEKILVFEPTFTLALKINLGSLLETHIVMFITTSRNTSLHLSL